jgi:DNA uptake protein ComE-like DNA-binding protein
MNWKNFTKSYLTFTKKDRIGLYAVLAIILIIYLLPKLFSKSNNDLPVVDNTLLLKAMDTLEERSITTPNRSYNNDYNNNGYQLERSKSDTYNPAGELFMFDPNLLPADGWKRLGLADRTIKTITNYLTKGGKFYKPEDVKRIWGLPQGFYERIEDYIKITPIQSDHYKTFDVAPKYEKKEKTITVVDVNNSDTAAFIALPGIGSKLSLRITNFRDKLGGFYSVEQIGETYGLPDSTFQKIKPYLNVNTTAVRKININAATKEDLKVHPYLKWNLANAIIEYRNQHGKFSNLNDLKNIVLIDEGTFNKIAPYLTL